MKEFIKEITPLLSALFGGFITYFVTVMSKNNELSLKEKIDARDKVWIPLCDTLEKLFEDIQNNTYDVGDLVSFSYGDSYKNEVTELFKYLKAKNRIFLYERTRNLLHQCKILITEYENEIEKAINSLEIEFRQSYSKMMEKHPLFINNNCMYCLMSTSKEFKTMLRKSILNSKDINCFGIVTSLTFIINDDFENYKKINITLDKDFYHNIWSALNSGYVSESDLDITDDISLSISVAEFEEENIENVNRIINAKIKDYNFTDMYRNIIEALTELQTEIYRSIDGITRLG